jgi:hypothetical protein
MVRKKSNKPDFKDNCELLVTVVICYLRSLSNSHSDPTSVNAPIAHGIDHFAVSPTAHLSLVVIYKAAVYTMRRYNTEEGERSHARARMSARGSLG